MKNGENLFIFSYRWKFLSTIGKYAFNANSNCKTRWTKKKEHVNLTIDQRIFLVVAQRQFDSIVKIDSVHNEM